MSFSTWSMLLALSLALAADAFAVALCQGAAARPGMRGALRIGGAFGVAQALMPLGGWAVGAAFAPVVRGIDHWIAFGLLVVLGAKMLRAGLTPEPPRCDPTPAMSGIGLFAAAVATSIDAAAAGVTLPTLGASLLAACVTIGAVTFATSSAGVFVGEAGGVRLGKRAEVAGGAALILIGAKILVEHVFFGG